MSVVCFIEEKKRNNPWNEHSFSFSHAFSVSAGFRWFYFPLFLTAFFLLNILLLSRYFNGCNTGADCKYCASVHVTIETLNLLTNKKLSGASSRCNNAFRTFDQTFQQVACQVENVCAKLAFFSIENPWYLIIDLGWPEYYLLLVREGDFRMFDQTFSTSRIVKLYKKRYSPN